MTQVDFEKGALVMACWRLASSSDTNELLAVCCAIRNSVIRIGPIHFPCYGAALNWYLSRFPLREGPLGREPQLVDPAEGLLAKVDGVYDNSLPDITSSLAHPAGALVFANPLRPLPEEVMGRVFIGRFGALGFYV